MNYLFSLFKTMFGWWDMKFSIFGSDGKGAVEAPKMSAQEQAYLAEITEMVKEQRAFTEMMMPAYAHQMHYKIEGDEWIPMSDAEWLSDPRTTDSQRRQFEIMTLQQRRTQQALEGELPLTEGMKRRREEEFEQLKAGTGITGTYDKAVAEDTIGIQKLKAFKQRWGEMEEAQRFGELGAGTQRLGALTGLTQAGTAGRIGGLQQLGMAQQPAIQGYASLMQPYQAYNQMGYQAQAATAANQAAMTGSVLGLGGMLGAAAIMSGRDKKKNIKKKTAMDENKALQEIKGTPSYEYEYKPGMGLGGKQLGSMAEESPGAYTMTDDETKFYLFEQYMNDKYPGQSAPAPSEEDFYEFEEMWRQQPGKSAPPLSEEDFYAFEQEWREKPGKSGKPSAINLGNKIEHQGMGLKALARKVDKLERRKSK